MGINGRPQPDRFRDLGGGKNIGGGKGKNGGGCFLVLLALAAPLLALIGGGWPA